jgi:N-methylhydantoinase B/oxoprolinase/acetone carboxylase alpha subunit
MSFCNDPYRGGLHRPEHTFFKPVFVDGKPIGFAVPIGHVCEVGGMARAGFAGEPTEVFHEGLRVPPREGQASWQGRRRRVGPTARECSHPALQFG